MDGPRVRTAGWLALLVFMCGCAPEPRPDVARPGSIPRGSVAAGEGGTSQIAPPPGPSPVAPPYTAADIRAALPVGTRWTVRTEAPNRDPEDQTITVVAATTDNVTLSLETRTRGVVETSAVTGPWEQLVNYDVFALGGRVEEKRVELPLGVRPCLVYTVAREQDGVPRKARFEFLRDQPGPPARITTWIGDRIFVTRTLHSFDVPERE